MARAADLGCGCGSASLGLVEAGMQVVRALDVPEREARVKVFQANAALLHGTEPGIADLRDPEVAKRLRAELGQLDLVFTRDWLPLHLVRHLWPRMFVVACRAGGDGDGDGVGVDDVRALFEPYYKVHHETVRASLVGVPQNRVDACRASHLGASFGPGARGTKARLNHTVMPKGISGRAIPRALNLRGIPWNPTVRHVLPAAGFDHFFMPSARRRRSKREACVFPIDGPAPRLTPQWCGARVHKHKYRPRPGDSAPIADAAMLGREELGRIQGFPEWFVWPSPAVVKHREVCRWIAESTPPQVAAFLAKGCHRSNNNNTCAPKAARLSRGDLREIDADAERLRLSTGDHAASKTSRKSKILALLGLPAPCTDQNHQEAADDPNTEFADKADCEPAVESYSCARDGRKRVRVKVGVSPHIDAKVQEMSRGVKIPEGWSFEVQDRQNKKFRFDDTFWIVPGHTRKLRSIAQVRALLLQSSIIGS